MNWASRIGENTSIVIERNLNARRHEQQSYPTCRAILSLADTSSPYLLEISCEQVLKGCKFPSFRLINNTIQRMSRDS